MAAISNSNKGVLSKLSKENVNIHIRVLFIAMMLSLMVCSGIAHAQVSDELEADIPFSFHAGNAKLPAGKYMIRLLDNGDVNLMEISNTDGSTSALFEVRPNDAKWSPLGTELVFNRYGNRYVLAQLFDQANTAGSEVVGSHYEKRVAVGVPEGQVHVAALSRKREQASSK